MSERENPEAKKAYYEEKIWRKAEELAGRRARLEHEQLQRYSRVQNREVNATGLHAQQLVGDLQAEYFEVEREIADIKAKENQLQKALENLDVGQLDETVLIELLGREEAPKISKRKQRIIEDRQRLGFDPRDGRVLANTDTETEGLPIGAYLETQRGPGGYKLTTGYHAKGIKGAIKPERDDYKDVAGQFYDATRDTHGGKAKHGKSTGHYVSKSGRRVRKI